ncbi:MAG TPA: TonB-dependent receptor [Candidatus Elarobacter sp.]
MLARVWCAAALAVALCMQSALPAAAAGTTGEISGRATDAKSGKPIVAAAVTAVSPSSRYATTTDANGFYAFTGVQPDTYTVTFAKTGFETLATQGVTVFADQTAAVNAPLVASLRTIGTTVVRSTRGSFQPSQTQDTYTVTSGDMQTLLGKSNATDEKSLLARLPGASLDVNGLPVLRGGRVNEEGFAFEGIEQTNAFNGLSQNAYRMNPGVGQLQLTPGPGDASTGNAGTGLINLIAKRGTYPAFGSLGIESSARPQGTQYTAEYGFATKDGKFSSYTMVLASRNGVQYGPWGTPADQISTVAFYQPAFATAHDVLENLVYRFGRGNTQSLQFLYQNQLYEQTGTYGDGALLPYSSSDPYSTFLRGALLGLTLPQQQQLLTLYPYQHSYADTLGSRGAIQQLTPSSTLKLQYTNSLNPSTFLSAKIYETEGVTTRDAAYDSARLSSLDILGQEGGTRYGTAVDLSKQLGSKHFIQTGVKYETNIPILGWYDPADAPYVFGGIAGYNSTATYAFINPQNPNPLLANCPIDPPQLAGTGKSYCGYLVQYLGANPGPVPALQQSSHTIRQDYAAYINDTISPNDRLKIALGLRLDGAHYQLPAPVGCDSLTADTCMYAQTGAVGGHPVVDVPNDAKNPLIPEPRLAVSYRLSATDAVRGSYGRSVELVPIKYVDQADSPSYYARYANIPSYDALGAMAAGVAPGQPFAAHTCGITGDRLCKSFGDQLFWADQTIASGIPYVPAKPETFNNYDVSYQHLFADNVGMRVTPFYRRGYDALALVAQIRLNPLTGQPFVNPATGAPQTGVSVTTNLGRDSASGIEFSVTRQSEYGFSASVSATYINEFSNVVPTSPAEDFQPTIPRASIALGDVYRVGFISPFTATAGIAYRSRSGWRINPILTYTRGFPLGVGTLVAGQVNGAYVNLPNTNATGDFSLRGVGGSPAYVDPQNPGTLKNPNIDATRGLPERSSPGGFLSSPSVNTDLSIEYSPPRSRSTFGVLISNLLNRTSDASSYFLNDRYQPVATGISGPQSGYSAFPLMFPNHGVAQYTSAEYGNQPYLVLNNLPPLSVRFYYQVKL